MLHVQRDIDFVERKRERARFAKPGLHDLGLVPGDQAIAPVADRSRTDVGKTGVFNVGGCVIYVHPDLRIHYLIGVASGIADEQGWCCSIGSGGGMGFGIIAGHTGIRWLKFGVRTIKNGAFYNGSSMYVDGSYTGAIEVDEKSIQVFF